uniref:NADH-ubiquinone oxidoreductase chain 5 n=2 Tax=Gelidium TaxID=2811 RepID=A0A1D8X7M0_9FLOR|nr:NADH dehydrogenase subunit 5 [Gelidium sinicola]YP_009559276.1 NADH dehydrogenase subunit 5 [Gelidium coulteri]AOX49024.1 NADH dehydrogenase subunit 5 [Gelidium sinicola]QBA96123.1 NADH dehydrogenase subunit 5 [Gelidium coulteri]
MYITIIWLPLLGSLISGFGGRWLGRYGASIFSTTCVISSFILSLLIFYEVGFCGITCQFSLLPWINAEVLLVRWGFLFDSVTAVMLVVITSISSLVHLYSISYMETDPHCPRFMAYLEVFTFFMLVLVTADNILQMFLGWEGVGLASYLLINFWFTRLAANQSAIKALVVNRVGDFGLGLAIFTIFYTFSSVEYLTIFSVTPFFQDYYFSFLQFKINSITVIGLLLFIGALGKSAQLGLHTWLPDAMEGPTPVSALIHAATMVTAGVFLIVRFSPLMEYSIFVLQILVIFGALTAFFAAMVGVFQNDLKRVIAYSTCSQLGYMVFACGLSCYNVSMFHLTNHAFFKALLFLSAGSVIHAVSDEQDMRRMGSLKKFLPLTYSVMLIGSLALAGFPFLAGFYSKDFIIEIAQALTNSNLNIAFSGLACWLGSLAVFFTAFYSFRLLYLTFINNCNMNRVNVNTTYESNLLILIPLIFLALGSVFVGYFCKDFFIGFGTDFWKVSIFNLPVHSNQIEAEYLQTKIKWLPFFLSVLGIILASFLNISSYRWYKKVKTVSFFAFLINKKWYWDSLYNKFLIRPVLNFGYSVSFKNLDRGFIEIVGPYGLIKIIPSWAGTLKHIQTGQITHYLFFTILGLCFFLIILFFPLTNYAIISLPFVLYIVLLFFI